MNSHLVAPNQVELERDHRSSSFQGGTRSLSIAYVGARGLHNWDVFDINQAPRPALSPIIRASTLTISGHIRVSPSFSKRKAV